MNTVSVILTPRDQDAKGKLGKWAANAITGGFFQKEFETFPDGKVIFKMTSPLNMPEDMIRKILDPLITKSVIDMLNQKKINTDLSIEYK